MGTLTIKAKDLKEIMANKFGEIVSKDNFVYNKSMNEFRRRNGEFIYIFNIEQVAWSSSFSFHIKLYVSQRRISEIIEKILGKQRHKITIGCDIERIYKSPDGRQVINGNLSIWIREDKDVEAAIESLQWYYQDIAKPYFERYQTLESIDDIINNPPFDHTPAHVGGMFFERCIKGLIVARLVNNPKYDELISIYDEEIKGTVNEEFIEAYNKAKEFLRYNDIKK